MYNVKSYCRHAARFAFKYKSYDAYVLYYMQILAQSFVDHQVSTCPSEHYIRCTAIGSPYLNFNTVLFCVPLRDQ